MDTSGPAGTTRVARRSLVRALFWTPVTIGAFWFAAYGLLNALASV